MGSGTAGQGTYTEIRWFCFCSLPSKGPGLLSGLSCMCAWNKKNGRGDVKRKRTMSALYKSATRPVPTSNSSSLSSSRRDNNIQQQQPQQHRQQPRKKSTQNRLGFMSHCVPFYQFRLCMAASMQPNWGKKRDFHPMLNRVVSRVFQKSIPGSLYSATTIVGKLTISQFNSVKW